MNCRVVLALCIGLVGFASCNQSPILKSDDRKVRVSLVGSLRSKLPSATVLEFNGTGPQRMAFKLSDMPVSLDAETFVEKDWSVSFYPNPKSRFGETKELNRLFSVGIAKEYFEKERDEVQVSLSPPKPELVSLEVPELVEVHFPTVNHQRFETLPYWDRKKNQLTSQVIAPAWKLMSDGKHVADGEMSWLCAYWEIDLPVAKSTLPLECEVAFDTGDAFGEELPVVSLKIENLGVKKDVRD